MFHVPPWSANAPSPPSGWTDNNIDLAHSLQKYVHWWQSLLSYHLPSSVRTEASFTFYFTSWRSRWPFSGFPSTWLIFIFLFLDVNSNLHFHCMQSTTIGCVRISAVWKHCSDLLLTSEFLTSECVLLHSRKEYGFGTAIVSQCYRKGHTKDLWSTNCRQFLIKTITITLFFCLIITVKFK